MECRIYGYSHYRCGDCVPCEALKSAGHGWPASAVCLGCERNLLPNEERYCETCAQLGRRPMREHWAAPIPCPGCPCCFCKEARPPAKIPMPPDEGDPVYQGSRWGFDSPFFWLLSFLAVLAWALFLFSRKGNL